MTGRRGDDGGERGGEEAGMDFIGVSGEGGKMSGEERSRDSMKASREGRCLWDLDLRSRRERRR